MADAVRTIPLTPEDPEQFREVELEGVSLRIRAYWIERGQSGWYIDIFRVVQDGEDKALGRGFRLRPGSFPLSGSGLLELPGVLAVIGPREYDREDLNERLFLGYVPESRVPE